MFGYARSRPDRPADTSRAFGRSNPLGCPRSAGLWSVWEWFSVVSLFEVVKQWMNKDSIYKISDSSIESKHLAFKACVRFNTYASDLFERQPTSCRTDSVPCSWAYHWTALWSSADATEIEWPRCSAVLWSSTRSDWVVHHWVAIRSAFAVVLEESERGYSFAFNTLFPLTFSWSKEQQCCSIRKKFFFSKNLKLKHAFLLHEFQVFAPRRGQHRRWLVCLHAFQWNERAPVRRWSVVRRLVTGYFYTSVLFRKKH